ncbi:alpha/beta hydrolase [Streptomyces sp. RerS4]|uniref:alpha/beta fold hydrolase n=1 Tax=Streptomyces sp. RerS4 TaxID=2942449 RepID=UPI00201CA963|nr:alpha/beta hydrolase [Streptomyces sp. RerS4]UQW99353.1 alpha/beta hydrolase [Streptomyces sp. RerS4]
MHTNDNEDELSTASSNGRHRRRSIMTALAVAGASAVGLAGPSSEASAATGGADGAPSGRPATPERPASGFVTTKDGVQIFYKDWGPRSGRPVVFSHGWPLNSDSWEAQMLFLAENGYRVVAHDRRGHGRSTQTWDGNDMNHYADDLAAVVQTLNLRDATLVGFSTGGGEVARYIGRHGTRRVAQAALISAVTPLMLKGPNNPNGVPMEVFDGLRAGSIADRSQLYKDLAAGPFFGANRAGAKVSQGMRDAFWQQGLQAGHKAAYDSIKAFSETDLTEDLKRFDVPTLIVHGDDDQVVPIESAAHEAARLVKGSTLKVYPGAPHGITDTHKQRLGEDLLAFVKSRR